MPLFLSLFNVVSDETGVARTINKISNRRFEMLSPDCIQNILRNSNSPKILLLFIARVYGK